MDAHIRVRLAKKGRDPQVDEGKLRAIAILLNSLEGIDAEVVRATPARRFLWQAYAGGAAAALALGAGVLLWGGDAPADHGPAAASEAAAPAAGTATPEAASPGEVAAQPAPAAPPSASGTKAEAAPAQAPPTVPAFMLGLWGTDCGKPLVRIRAQTLEAQPEPGFVLDVTGVSQQGDDVVVRTWDRKSGANGATTYTVLGDGLLRVTAVEVGGRRLPQANPPLRRCKAS